MKNPPSLDAHAHLDPAAPSKELASAGAVLAMTFGLEEAEGAVGRRDPRIAWGVGAHPRRPRPQQDFEVGRFDRLTRRTAVVGEVGLDGRSRVPMRVQRRTFAQVLEVVADLPRIVSIHSAGATALVLEAMERKPIAVPVLHRWAGSLEETRAAVALGCYFSIPSALARHARFRIGVPLERILIETDHGAADPPAAIPCRIEWAEHLIAQQFSVSVGQVRMRAWENLTAIVRRTNTWALLPETLAELVERSPAG
jgi:TatD DNase family protein